MSRALAETESRSSSNNGSDDSDTMVATTTASTASAAAAGETASTLSIAAHEAEIGAGGERGGIPAAEALAYARTFASRDVSTAFLCGTGGGGGGGGGEKR